MARFADVLQREPSQIKPEADFFALGGDSLLAGKLIAGLRAEFAVAVPIGMVFNEGTPNAIGRFIEENVPDADEAGAEKRPSGCTETNSSTRWWLMLVQLIPMCCLYPLRRGFQWTMFMVALTYTHLWPTAHHIMGRLMGLILAIMFAQFCARIVMPLLGLVAKWTIIGRHREEERRVGKSVDQV